MAEFDSRGTFQKAADEYAKIQDAFPEVIRDPLLADMAVKEGDRILDLPCGTGDSIVKAMELAGPTGHALAIDISPSMIEEAKEKAEAAGVKNIQFVVEGMDEARFDAAAYDIVVSSNGPFFASDLKEFLVRMWGAVKPGGKLVLMTLGRNFLTPISGVFLDLAQNKTEDLQVSTPWRITEDILFLRKLLEEVTDGQRIKLTHRDAVMNYETADGGWNLLMGTAFRNYTLKMSPEHQAEIEAEMKEWMRTNRQFSATCSFNNITVTKDDA
ncbi:class I SAM-dependent methyltransferase [Streptomyces somaliensis DSM 40738]|uniref:Class I SAM-dependent methyltransferase n=1 Tax=Streptomyces somaliensis (strain ATCC 33201 / DSM 40738 / JCM 12659 / KCTC 9044 / NCTC 11332 / NRRL B-12077 / IP 733) TaxID=1134445 RepID=A0AA44DBX6_STRE0|nr:class I SAM-dependent methyltransferase [Streptomyces somaliensis]MCQ0025160.1 class I SAM-dependent methyltransferase [Streptomyces somaliensis DSM 40738]NKY13406.1 class I SAM-dependent methyltransferase [Streptomyces somaliensis DSM 40738]